MNTHRYRKRSAAAALLTASLAITGTVATATAASAAPAGAELDYFAQTIPDLRTGSVFEAVTYERFESLLNSSGTFAFLIGGPADAGVQAAASRIDAVAQQYGVDTIYAFDPLLDGNAIDVRDSSIEQVAALWANLTENYLNRDTTPEFDGSDEPYLVVYDRDRVVGEDAAEDRIVASLVSAAGDESFDAELAELFESVSTDGQAQLATRSQFDFFSAAINNRHQAQYSDAEKYGGEILGAAQAENFVLKSITYPELLTLLETPGDHTILFGGTWCHNTRAVVRDVNDKAAEAGVDTVYVFDLRLDGLSGAPLHVRDSASPLSYLYGDLVDQYLPGLRTQFGFDRNTIAYQPGGDQSAEAKAQQRLQVPYLIEYSTGAEAPIAKDWISDNGDGTFTEFMTEFWWVNELPGNRNANRYPATVEGDAAWAAEQQRQWDFGNQALAELDVFFGLESTDGENNGGENEGTDGEDNGTDGENEGTDGEDNGTDEVVDPVPSLEVTGDLRPGGTITVTGSGLPTEQQLRVELHSDPVLLGTASSDAEGDFTLTATIPSTVEAGAHSVVVSLNGVEIVSTSVTIAAANGEPIAVGGAEGGALVALGAAAAGLLLAGGALILARKRAL